MSKHGYNRLECRTRTIPYMYTRNTVRSMDPGNLCSELSNSDIGDPETIPLCLTERPEVSLFWRSKSSIQATLGTIQNDELTCDQSMLCHQESSYTDLESKLETS